MRCESSLTFLGSNFRANFPSTYIQPRYPDAHLAFNSRRSGQRNRRCGVPVRQTRHSTNDKFDDQGRRSKPFREQLKDKQLPYAKKSDSPCSHGTRHTQWEP
jgi:hypothetical protein